MQAEMTAQELQTWLRTQFPKENERHEWKGWRDLKHRVNGRGGDDLISYVSALANMDGGALVLGVEDTSLRVLGINCHDLTPEELKFRLVELCTNLPAEGLVVEERVASDTQARVWVIHIPKHLPRQPVMAHGKAWQRVGDSLVELRDDRRSFPHRDPEDRGAAPHYTRQYFRGAQSARQWHVDRRSMARRSGCGLSKNESQRGLPARHGHHPAFH